MEKTSGITCLLVHHVQYFLRRFCWEVEYNILVPTRSAIFLKRKSKFCSKSQVLLCIFHAHGYDQLVQIMILNNTVDVLWQ